MMSQLPARGINRQGLDAAFEANEALKSKLLLEAQLLRECGQDESAARKFAEAAEIEERLSDACAANGLREKSFAHRFSAASGWSQAGNFYQAIEICDELLSRDDLPERLRQRILSYVQTLRSRRAQLYAGLVLEASST